MSNDMSQLAVLIVDPDSAMAALTRDVVRSLGITAVDAVRDPDRALSELRTHRHDIVIIERDMAPLDGIDLTRAIRRDEENPDRHIAVLMVTAQPTREMVFAARDAGVTEFLIKPFSVKDLHTRISAILNHPRRFIEVSDYFGPDRRRTDRGFDGEDRRGKGAKG